MAASRSISRCCISSSRGLGVTNVHFTGHVSDAELTAYYDVADLFLCASAHEGFCVPIVESFYKQIPVVAYAATRGARRPWMAPACSTRRRSRWRSPR